MSCGKHPCLCKSTIEEKLIKIPFMGDASVTNQTTPEQLATFIDPSDRIAVLLALSLYTGTPRNNLPPWELIQSSVTPRTACWMFENTIICATRGTQPTSTGGRSDILDDQVTHPNTPTPNTQHPNTPTPQIYKSTNLQIYTLQTAAAHIFSA